MLDWFSELIETFGELILSVLPTSPFTPFLRDFAGIPYLSWLNWFIPIEAMCKVFLGWLTSVAVFYLYSIIMRWIKMIGD